MDRTDIRGYARRIIDMDPLFLDTETTGLDKRAEIVEIAVIDLAGETVMESLVCPGKDIPRGATAIHGIRQMDVFNAPSFYMIWPTLHTLITDHALVIYNKAFDVRLIAQSYQPARRARYRRVFCAMAMAAAWFGVERIGLVDACRQGGIEFPKDGKPHRAAYDCEMTRRLLLYMGR